MRRPLLMRNASPRTRKFLRRLIAKTWGKSARPVKRWGYCSWNMVNRMQRCNERVLTGIKTDA